MLQQLIGQFKLKERAGLYPGPQAALNSPQQRTATGQGRQKITMPANDGGAPIGIGGDFGKY